MKNTFFILVFLFCIGCQNRSHNKPLSRLDSLSFLIGKDSLNSSLLHLRSKIYLENNNLALAKNDIENAYQIFKNDVDILLTRGSICYALNQTRISKKSWERCLKIDPNHISCRENLTELLCAVRDPKCKPMIDTLSILNNGIISTSLIAYLKELKEYKISIELLNNLLVHYPEGKEVLSLLSIIHSDTSVNNNFFDEQLAEQYFKKIIQLYPNYPQVYYNFGKHKQNLSQYNEALKQYNLAVQLNSSDKQSYYNMGFCAMQLKNYNPSINYFTKAINIDNSFLLAYHARAYLYELTNNEHKAKSDWKNCLMLNPSYIPALKGLAKH